MTATKQCPSCGSQWPADAPYCGNCATSLHNVQVQSPSHSTRVVGELRASSTRIDDEYITMFRAPSAPDGIALAHLQRVEQPALGACAALDSGCLGALCDGAGVWKYRSICVGHPLAIA